MGYGPAVTRHLAYFVHDLGDAAVARRVRMLHAGGMQVTVIGFYRHGTPPSAIDGAATIALGATADGRLWQRGWAVLRTLFRFGRVGAATRGCDVIMARNLEMLVIARRARGRRRLVYECLDIHRLLLGRSMAARCIQAVERRSLRHISLVITSSPRFIHDYFHRRRLTSAPMLLVENKVLTLGDGPGPAVSRPARPLELGQATPGPPWVIGWFGILRCRRSLHLLIDMVRDADGRIELVLAGIPAARELGDLDGLTAGLPGIRVLGRYRPDDLPVLYGAVHFAWAIDYFEEGLNSAWLLPNRLYEALAHGAVPIALAEVETGAWLRRHRVGVVVDMPANDVPARLDGLSPADYAALRTAAAQLPGSAVAVDQAACEALVAAIADGRMPTAAAI